MRVTFLVANYRPSVGGAQLLVQHVAEGLVARHGHEVHVVTSDALLLPGSRNAGRAPVGDEVVGGVVVHRRPVARRTHAVLRGLRRVLGRMRADTALQATQLAAAGPLGWRLAAATRSAARSSDVLVGVSDAVLTVLAGERSTRRTRAQAVSLPLLHLAGGPPRPAALESIRRGARAVALTDFEREWLVGHGVDGHRAVVIPPGCEPELYPAVASTDARRQLDLPDRPTIGYIGRMALHKGIDTLLESMQIVWSDHPEVTVLLAGNRTGWHGFDELVRRVAAVAGDRLVVRDGFTEEEKPLLYSACDVVAFPSREESFGMVTLEAWCARRAVVAGDIGAVRSLVREGSDGDLVAVDDVVGWAEAIGALLDDPDRRERYGRSGRRRAEQEFSWPAVIDRWNDLLVAAIDPRAAAVI